MLQTKTEGDWPISSSELHVNWPSDFREKYICSLMKVAFTLAERAKINHEHWWLPLAIVS